MNYQIFEGVRQKFSHINPLVVHRSCEHAQTPGELFDILDTLPPPPFIWDSKIRRWRTVNNMIDPKAKTEN